MASTISAEVEIKSAADKFWGGLRDSTNIFPKAFPHDYKSIVVTEGDGKAAGSVRHFTYAEGSPIVKESWEKIEEVDEEKKFVRYAVVEGDLLKYYKPFKGTIIVVPKGEAEGSLVKWSCVFDKASDEVPDPHVVKDFAVKNFLELDDLLLKA